MPRLHPLLLLGATVALTASRPVRVLAAQTRPAPRPALDTAGMDRSVKPGDNFFRYANGTWLERTEIPADRSSYGAGAMLTKLTDRRVAGLIQAAKSGAPADSEARKIGDYHASFTGTTAIDAAGLKPLRPTLDSIAAIRDRAGLARFLGTTLRADVDALNTADFYTENLLGLWVARGGVHRRPAVLHQLCPELARKTREPALRNPILTDGHAPAEYRASTVRNLDAWYPAFDVKPGQALYLAPGDRVRVW
jgi:predicted metalloendopeptidase